MENNTGEMVPVFSSSNHDAEMEATTIKGLLDSNDIPAMIVGPHMLPNLEFQVQVSRELAAQAKTLIAEARAGGPASAVEAEKETE